MSTGGVVLPPVGTQGSALHQTHLCCHCLQRFPVTWVCLGQWLLPETWSGIPSDFLSSLVPAHLSALPVGSSTGLKVYHTLFLLLASMKVPCSDMGWFDLLCSVQLELVSQGEWGSPTLG